MCALVIAAFSVGFAAPAAALDRLVDDSCHAWGAACPSTTRSGRRWPPPPPGETIGVVSYSPTAIVTRNLVQSSNVGILMEEVSGCTVSVNSVTFNAVGIDLVGSDGCTLGRNNVTRNEVVDCRWDEAGAHTFVASACGTELPPGAWD